jgi:hypothetical protein
LETTLRIQMQELIAKKLEEKNENDIIKLGFMLQTILDCVSDI